MNTLAYCYFLCIVDQAVLDNYTYREKRRYLTSLNSPKTKRIQIA